MVYRNEVLGCAHLKAKFSFMNKDTVELTLCYAKFCHKQRTFRGHSYIFKLYDTT